MTQMEPVMTVIFKGNSIIISYAGNHFWQLGIHPHTDYILHDLQGPSKIHFTSLCVHFTLKTGCYYHNHTHTYIYRTGLQMQFFNNVSKLLMLYSLLSSLVLIITWPNFSTNVFNNLMEEEEEEGGEIIFIGFNCFGGSNWACTPFYNSFLSARGFSYLL